MNVQIQAVKFDADRKLIEFVEAKMAKLDRFIERATGADVILKLDKDNEKGNKVAIIRIEVPGDDLVAEARSKSFEESVDNAIDALKKQIEKHKDRFAKYSPDSHAGMGRSLTGAALFIGPDAGGRLPRRAGAQ